MTKIQEIWKDIPDYEGKYQASSLGRIKSLGRAVNVSGPQKAKRIKEKIFSALSFNQWGYANVGLSYNGKTTTQRTHRLIALTFVPNPLGLPQVNHKNGIKSDNRAENLEWVTNRENVCHYYRGKRKLPTGVYLQVRGNYSRYVVSKHINGKGVHVGYFHTIEDASRAYQNFPTNRN